MHHYRLLFVFLAAFGCLLCPVPRTGGTSQKAANNRLLGDLYPIEEGGKKGFIDVWGTVVVECQYIQAFTWLAGEEFARVTRGSSLKDQRWLLLDRSGTTVHEARGIEDMRFKVGENRMATGETVDEELGVFYANTLIDFSGTTIGKFEAINGVYSEGLLRARQGGKWGYVDYDGKWVIPARYEMASDFSEGVALARAEGKEGYIDHRGNWVIKPIYERAYPFNVSVP